MSAFSFLRSGVIASSLVVGVGIAVSLAGCASSTDGDNDGSTSEDLSASAHGFGNHGGPGGGDHGGGGPGGGGPGGGGHGGPGFPGGPGGPGGHGQGGHGHGPGQGIHGPHHGGHGAGLHHPGGHMGRPGPEHVDAPANVYFANITANGTGCPDGSWDVGISDDGQTFTLAFSSYEAQVAEGQAIDMKNCTLDINLGSTEGLSFAVASFYYQGYVLLDDGMSARQTASYFFDHDNEHDVSKNDVAGPFDDSYLFTDDVPAQRQVWSPCGQPDTLHVKTQLVMRNNPQNTGEGYINNSTVDGSLSIKWALAWRRCQ